MCGARDAPLVWSRTRKPQAPNPAADQALGKRPSRPFHRENLRFLKEQPWEVPRRKAVLVGSGQEVADEACIRPTLLNVVPKVFSRERES